MGLNEAYITLPIRSLQLNYPGALCQIPPGLSDLMEWGPGDSFLSGCSARGSLLETDNKDTESKCVANLTFS